MVKYGSSTATKPAGHDVASAAAFAAAGIRIDKNITIRFMFFPLLIAKPREQRGPVCRIGLDGCHTVVGATERAFAIGREASVEHPRRHGRAGHFTPAILVSFGAIITAGD